MFNTPTRARPVRSERSSEAPMDFEYTDRPAVTPSWAPRKHALDDAPGAPPAFGAGTNVPFIFHTPMPEPEPWAPPQGFSPAQAFPDVDMAEPEDGTRALALGGMKRVYRRRRREARARDASDGSSTEEDDDDDRDDDRRRLARRTPHRVEKHYTLNMSAGSAPRSELPVLLLGYLQVFFNLSLVLVFLYLLLQFILTVQRDVEQRIADHSLDIAQEISACAAHYRANACASGSVPAMAAQCAAWEQCMARDPSRVGRARVGAELVAEVVNGFVEPISWKTLAFTLSSLAFLTLFVNTLLTLYRGRLAPPPQQQQQHAPYAHHHPPPVLPGWPQQWRPAEVLDAPSRRRKLDGGAEQRVP